MTRAKKDTSSFEKDLEGLEGIVTALEEGGLSLDDALKRFEEGIKLARKCEKALNDAEKKIEILTKNVAGEAVTRPFDETAEAAPPSPPDTSRLPEEPPLEEPPEEEEDELLF